MGSDVPARRLLYRRSGWLLMLRTCSGWRVRTRVVMDDGGAVGALMRCLAIAGYTSQARDGGLRCVVCCSRTTQRPHGASLSTLNCEVRDNHGGGCGRTAGRVNSGFEPQVSSHCASSTTSSDRGEENGGKNPTKRCWLGEYPDPGLRVCLRKWVACRIATGSSAPFVYPTVPECGCLERSGQRATSGLPRNPPFGMSMNFGSLVVQ